MNQKVSKNITTIIFDLGGVLFDIDYSLTQQAFIALGAKDFQQQYSQQMQHGVFDEFEKGKVSPAYFREVVLKWLPANSTEQQVDNAWNALLIGFPKEKVELVKRLRNKYRIFLLSNTNDIHLPAVMQMMEKEHGKGIMRQMFHKEYYSCRMGMRKPDAVIYEHVIKENSLNPSSTLFVDDLIQNVNAAAGIGIQTLHCNKQVNLFQYFEE
ncbi:MAG TPA: HAD family phosphatase [Bacteroidia bacterium]|jgi:epoxide hydrolase-like predicted phosphatase|nr:HAD family phosphatase [Bacteroidia bacterium]